MKAYLFDLDGTLLPMENHEFEKIYTKTISAAMSKVEGKPPELLGKGIWKGLGDMVANDGSKTNREVFWKSFGAFVDTDGLLYESAANKYYETDFELCRAATKPNPKAVELVTKLKARGNTVVLATNSVFPISAIKARLGWTGLNPSMFDYITLYDNSRYCKPNPEYYADILKKLNLNPKDCVMTGNDEEEDMYAASVCGIQGKFVCDCGIASVKHPYGGRRYTFSELADELLSE